MQDPKDSLEVIKKRLFNRVHKTGEEVNLDFPNALRVAIEREAWRHYQDAEGKPFENIADWLHYCWPSGVSMGSDRYAMTYEQAMAHCEGHPDVYAVLAKHAPKGKPGRKKKGEELKCVPTSFSRNGTTKNKPTLAARLAQERPQFFEAYQRGQYTSIHAAAEAAGLIKPSNDPLMRLKSNWSKATAAQRKAFLKWIEADSGK